MKLHEIATPSNYITHVEQSGGEVKVWVKRKQASSWQGYIHAELTPYKQWDGSILNQLNVVEVYVIPTMRKRGLGSFLYNKVEQVTGYKIQPSGELSDDAVAFWLKRDPTLSRDHLDDYTYGSFDSYDSDFAIPQP